MGIFGRSWELTKTSFHIVREEKELLVFSILSIIFSILLVAAFIIPLLLGSIAETISGGNAATILLFVLIFLLYLGLAFIATFFNVCVVYTAAIKFSNGDPRFTKTIKFAISKLHLIFMWSLVSAVVGVLLYALENLARRTKGAGGIAIMIMKSLFGIAWSLATIFVIPVMVYKNVGPFAAIKESVKTFKKTWGEYFVKSIGMGLIMLLVIGIVLVPMILIIFLVAPLGISYVFLGVGVTIILIAIVFIVFGVAEKVYDTALYVYAETGHIVGGYNKEIFESAFKNKKPGKLI